MACAGYYCVSGKITACPSGYHAFGQNSACSVCPSGWICTDGIAEPCQNTTYATAWNGTCQACPNGYACRGGRRIQCDPGSYGLGTSDCNLCQYVFCADGAVSKVVEFLFRFADPVTIPSDSARLAA